MILNVPEVTVLLIVTSLYLIYYLYNKIANGYVSPLLSGDSADYIRDVIDDELNKLLLVEFEQHVPKLENDFDNIAMRLSKRLTCKLTAAIISCRNSGISLDESYLSSAVEAAASKYMEQIPGKAEETKNLIKYLTTDINKDSRQTIENDAEMKAIFKIADDFSKVLDDKLAEIINKTKTKNIKDDKLTVFISYLIETLFILQIAYEPADEENILLYLANTLFIIMYTFTGDVGLSRVFNTYTKHGSNGVIFVFILTFIFSFIFFNFAGMLVSFLI